MTRRIRDAPYQDPTIGGAAGACFGEIWEGIEREVRAGTPYFVARERALVNNIPWIRKRYGDAVADRIVKTVSHCGPEFFTRETQAEVRRQRAERVRRNYEDEGRRIGLLNRLWLWAFGLPLYRPPRR